MKICSNNSIKDALIKMKANKKKYLLVTNEDTNNISLLTLENVLDLYLNNIDTNVSLKEISLKEIKTFNMSNVSDDIFSTNEVIFIKNQHKNTPVTKLDFITDKLKKMLQINDQPKEQNIINLLNSLNEDLKIYYNTLENIPLSIFISNSEGKIIYLNKKFEKSTGIVKTELLGRNLSYIKQLDLFSPLITPIILYEKRQISITQKITTNKLNTIVTGIPIFNEDQTIKWVITASRELQKEELISNIKKRKNTLELGSNKLIMESDQMYNIFQLTKQISAVLSTVLITGESGVGKDLIAELIHEQSDRKSHPFIHINCGAIPEPLLESELFGYESGAFSGASSKGKQGLIETANKGTLFLDEIGDMPFNLQVKILKFLQNKSFTRIGGTKSIEVDVRIIAATNTNLSKQVQEKNFRLDLFYRLNVIPIKIPPLRNRIKDILPLANLFLKHYTIKHKKDLQFTFEFENELIAYDWPGNIRELDNLIERLVVTTQGRFIKQNNLSEGYSLGMSQHIKNENNNYDESIIVNKLSPLNKAINYVESQLINMAYEQTKNSYKVAELLEISQSSAHRKIRKFVDDI